MKAGNSSIMEKLDLLRMKDRKLVIGLMSGTSVDGVDCALCSISGHGPKTRVKLFAFKTYPYPQKVKNRIHSTFHGSVKDVCEVNFILGEIFARANKVNYSDFQFWCQNFIF